MITVEIDGKKLTVEEGSTIIEAADAAGIYIPRFCYHKKLSIAANCRMCLVEVEKSRKPLPACATPMTDGMQIKTQSKMALEAQRIVMEFLLINHPLDCPICDQGGECELQDTSMGYGEGFSHYDEPKRTVFKEDLGPLIDTGMTRCIHCTRCVRFGDELAGLRELGATGRGENTQIGTYVKHFMQSEVSGNVIDLCPVGALTSKPYRYSGRSWEMQQYAGIAPHDCLGSNIFLHVKGQEYAPQKTVMRVVPCENEAINENWISDRDRFSYEGVHTADRALKPMIKRAGQWQEMTWQQIIPELIDRLKVIMQQAGQEQVGGLIGPQATLEEMYLFQAWLRGVGVNNIDHRLRETDFADQHEAPLFPGLPFGIDQLEQQEAILLVGSHIRHEQPVLAMRLRQASQEATKVMAINTVDYNCNFSLTEKIIAPLAQLPQALAEVAVALQQKTDKSSNVKACGFEDIKPSDVAIAMAEQLLESQVAVIVLGVEAEQHPQAATLRRLVKLISELSGAKAGRLSSGPNAAGAWLAGAVPHRAAVGQSTKEGLHVTAMLEAKLKAYLLWSIEPEFDFALSAKAIAALKNADLVVSFASHANDFIKEHATMILPIAPFSENAGTFVNAAGSWQEFRAASVPCGEVRPGWKVLRVLSSLMDVALSDCQSALDVACLLKQQLDEKAEGFTASDVVELSLPDKTSSELHRHAPWPIYRTDSLVRRAKALQQTPLNPNATIRINAHEAKNKGLSDGQTVVVCQNDQRLSLVVEIDLTIADNTAILYSGLSDLAGFGQVGAPITITTETGA